MNLVNNLGLTVIELTNRKLTGGLPRAIDNSFHAMIERARQDWQRRFAGQDPSDACVTVKITGTAARPVRAETALRFAH